MENEQNQDNSTNTQNQMETKTPDKILYETRKAKGLTIKNVSEYLHLLPSYIEALESGNYSKIPAPAFVKGYMRTYASYLDLDADALIAQLPAEYQIERVFAKKEDPNRSVKMQKLVFWFISIFFILGLIGLTFYWSRMDNSSTQPSAYNVEVEPAEEGKILQPITNEANAVAADNVVTEYQQNEVTEPVSETVEPQPAQPAEEVASTTTIETKKDASDNLSNPNNLDLNRLSRLKGGTFVLTFTGECWVQASDADGNQILEANAKQGDLIKIDGKKPIKIILGKAANVKANYLGKPFNLEKYTGETVARFSIY